MSALHDAIVLEVRKKLSRRYGDIKVNLSGKKEHSYKGQYPDLLLGEAGMVLALLEVETEETLGPERPQHWKALLETGLRVILLVPKHAKAQVMELLWQHGLAERLALGSYEVQIAMP